MPKQFIFKTKYHIKRAGILIGAVVLFISSVLVFVNWELNHNHKVYLNNFSGQQQLLTDQVAIRLESYLESGQYNSNEAISKIMAEVETTGNRFWFVAMDQKLIFVKNEASTKLYESIPLNDFIRENKAEGLVISNSTKSFDQYQYTIGICTKEDYIEEEGQLFRHSIYIYMPLILLCSFVFILSIYGIYKKEQSNTKISQLKEEASKRNLALEQLSTMIVKKRLTDLEEGNGDNNRNRELKIYQKPILDSLLNKINMEKIAPVTILIIELASKKNEISRDKFHDLIKTISPVLNQDHVLAEVQQGVFAVLIFHTSSDQIPQLQKRVIEEWAIPLKEQGIKIKMGNSCYEDTDGNVITVFKTVLNQVIGKEGKCE